MLAGLHAWSLGVRRKQATAALKLGCSHPRWWQRHPRDDVLDHSAEDSLAVLVTVYPLVIFKEHSTLVIKADRYLSLKQNT